MLYLAEICGIMKLARKGATNADSSLTNLSIKETNMAKSNLPKKQKTIKICSIETCDKNVGRGGFCHHHYKAYRISTVPPPTVEQITKYFWSLTEIKDKSECWIWKGNRSIRKGGDYGRFALNYRVFQAHRVSFFIHNGKWAENQVLHSCDNPPCVNPHHLREGTNDDNIADKVARNRQRKGSKHPNAKLTEEIVKTMKIRLRLGETRVALASEYGVHYVTVLQIDRGLVWKHVEI
jgi:hypothetical protein